MESGIRLDIFNEILIRSLLNLTITSVTMRASEVLGLFTEQMILEYRLTAFWKDI